MDRDPLGDQGREPGEPGEPGGLDPVREAGEPPADRAGPAGAAELRPLPRFPVRLAVGLYAGLGAIALVWRAAVDGEPAWLAPGAAGGGVDWLGGPGLGGVGVGLAVGLALVAASRWWTGRSPAGRALARALADAVAGLSPGAVAALALASGLAEELFFRGALQPRVGFVLATLLFGAAHFVPRRDLVVWSAFATAVGALFGALFEWTGGVAAPAAAHVVVNGLNLHWLAREGAQAS